MDLVFYKDRQANFSKLEQTVKVIQVWAVVYCPHSQPTFCHIRASIHVSIDGGSRDRGQGTCGWTVPGNQYSGG
jgi:hypothetical protein